MRCGYVHLISIPLLLMLLVFFGACNIFSGSDIPDIRGTYGAGIWDINFTNEEGNIKQFFCNGKLTVTSQSESSFTGNFIADECGYNPGDNLGNLSGEVEGSFDAKKEELTISLVSKEGYSVFLELANELITDWNFDHCNIIEEDKKFSGTIVPREELAFVAQGSLGCPETRLNGEVSFASVSFFPEP